MVKHMIFWALKPEKKAEAGKIAAELDAKFKGLVGVVDGLTETEVGQNYNGGPYDLALNCTFSSRDAEKAYQNHPAHVAIKEVVHTLVCARECIDYEK